MLRDRSNIAAAKKRLPLPDLLRKLGHQPPGAGEGNMRSPFVADRRQKTLSFSIFHRPDGWGWCDRTGGQEIKGDEITLLEKLERLSRANAIARYLALAGVKAAQLSDSSVELDWPAAVSKFTDNCASHLAQWRGISIEFIEWLRALSLIGLCKGAIAFPVRNPADRTVSAHIRPKNGRWFYWPKGAGIHPLIIGDLATAERTLVFESQWDAFAIMDAMAWHDGAPDKCAVLITRGASNGRLAARAAGAVYAWPQNDPPKNGRSPGEEWLCDVARHARGDVFCVETPSRFKDANDWTRAETVDVWAAINTAPRLTKPEQNVLRTNDTGGGAPNPPVPVDPIAALEELGLYWLNGSSSYFLRRCDGEHVRFIEMGAAEIKRKLRVRGYRARPDADAGETVSTIDRILDAATETRSVDFAVSIAGTKAGIYDLPGGHVLVRESPRLINPCAGDYRTIEDFLTSLLGIDGAIRFCCWLKVAFEALRAGERRPGQALILIGPPDCGKSRIQHQIITPILAGRSADPKSFFFARTDFNAELVGAEHLLIEEVPSSSRHEERLFFGERIKEIVANDTTRLHKKNRDAVTVQPFWRLSITLNDNREKLRCLPPLIDDFAEKIVMLEAKPAPEFWARFASADDPRKAFRDAINADLPAFAQHLIAMAIPEKLKKRRWGVQSFVPEEMEQLLFEGEQEYHLWLLINKAIFDGGGDDEPWKGDAEDLKQTLCAEHSTVRGSANRLLGGVQLSTIGIWLTHLEKRFPSRVERAPRTSSQRPWIIHPPVS